MRNLYFLAGLFSAGVGFAQAPAADWIRQFNPGSTSPVPAEMSGKSVVTDADGNIYTTGILNGSTGDLNPSVGAVSLSSILSTGGFSTADIFVTKYNADGSLEWVKQMGGEYTEAGTDLAVDGDGNVYITGYYNGDPDFDPNTATEVLGPVNGLDNIFLVKLDADGAFVWLRTFGSAGVDASYGVELDADGNIYLAGFFGGTIDFDPGAGTTSLTPNGSSDVFALKLDENGDLVWVRQFNGSDIEYGYGLAVDSDMHVYVCGAFYSDLDLDPGVGDATFGTNGDYDMFWVELDNDGNYVWGNAAGGLAPEFAYAIDVDNAGNSYVTGALNTMTPVLFGGTTFISATGGTDAFVAKYNTSGTLQWATAVGGGNYDLANDIAVDDAGNNYITGYYTNNVDFDPGTGTHEVTSIHNSDFYLLKLDSDGNFGWVKTYGGGQTQTGEGIALIGSDEFAVTGSFMSDMAIDGTTIYCSPPPTAFSDVFLIKLSGSGAPSGMVEEENQTASFTAYPNPATDQLWITSAEATTIRIFSTTGELVLSTQVQPGTQSIAIDQLANGIYILQTDFGQQTKFVKQ